MFCKDDGDFYYFFDKILRGTHSKNHLP
jgi:hypothetical protein